MREEMSEEPAHHARRPMNAFLIFCKRHRSVVRDKYPNLENRSITKILGEWWANLDKEEKACYTGLAKQYKDAFFNANPDFKWYKLPAPPLRTLASRPSTHEKFNQSPKDDREEELEKINNNSTEVDFNHETTPIQVYDNEPKSLSMFTPGKLADEAQMGGLSSLLATKTESHNLNPYYSPPTYRTKAISSNDRKNVTREDSIRELQNALSETTRMFEDLDEDKVRMYRQSVQNEYTNQDVIDQIVDKRFFKDDDYMKQWSDDEKYLRSGRSCKGKRYQEFMAVGGLKVNKRQKRDSDKSPDETYTASCSWKPDCFNDDEVASKVKDDYNSNSPDTAETDEIDADSANKSFKAADFDLDAKIRALPSLSLEKFQQRKRENKRKKKNLNFRPKASEHKPMINTVPRPYKDDRHIDSCRDHVIGSQKRKPRKISITRLEFNSLVPTIDYIGGHNKSPEIKVATEAPCTVQNMEICRRQTHDHGLYALETLAEIASKTSKIGETSILEQMSAISDDNASVV